MCLTAPTAAGIEARLAAVETKLATVEAKVAASADGPQIAGQITVSVAKYYSNDGRHAWITACYASFDSWSPSILASSVKCTNVP